MLVKEPLPSALQASDYAGDQRTSTIPLHPSESLYSRANPNVFFNVFMLSLCLFCTVSFIISIVCFSIVSHHLCSCAVFGAKFAANYQIYDTSTWSKKERIVQWVMQQSQLTDQTDLPQLHHPDMVLADGVPPLNRKKLSALHSSATNSTKLSLYET